MRGGWLRYLHLGDVSGATHEMLHVGLPANCPVPSDRCAMTVIGIVYLSARYSPAATVGDWSTAGVDCPVLWIVGRRVRCFFSR